MKQSVLMMLTALAGLAVASHAMAQSRSFDVELVFDNDPRLAAIGVNYGANALLPGPQATAVGITLLARMSTQGTAPNFGVIIYGSGTQSGQPDPLNSIFYHNDAISNQTNAAWTSAALALGRGSISSNTAPGAARGLMQYTQPAGASGAGESSQAVNFRTFVAASGANRNTVRTNSNIIAAANESQPINYIYNAFTNPAGGNQNGWVGVNLFGDFDGAGSANPANTYPNVPGSGAILAVTARRADVLSNFDANGDPLPTVVNFGGTTFNDSNGNPRAIAGSDQDPSAAGVQSTWYALYHLVFFPQADSTRDVTVSSSGYINGGENIALAFGGQSWALSQGRFESPGFAPVLRETAVTFQVPTPSVAAVFPALLAFAGRRRRSAR